MKRIVNFAKRASAIARQKFGNRLSVNPTQRRVSMRTITFASLLILSLIALPLAALAGSQAYAMLGSGDFGTLDLTTGQFTFLGAGPGYRCLASFNGTLYTLDDSVNLYTVNPTNGNQTLVGNLGSGLEYGICGSTTKGLYYLSYEEVSLYSINPATGAATLLGPSGIPFQENDGISAGSSSLYVSVGNGTLYLMNTKTGKATPVGPMGGVGSTIYAMAYENGVMYAATISPNSIYAVNTSRAAGTFIANITGAASSIWGLAPGTLLNVNPTSIRFASENVGKTSPPKTVTLTNTGATSISIAGIFASAPFAQTNTCGSGIAVNSSCTVSVTFTPAAAGGATGALQIDDDASGNPQTIPLSGTGK
jgi:hypothetical protein